jgi:hypothetical protein
VTRSGADRISQVGLTRNISSGGVLFTAERETDVGMSIEYVITLGSPENLVNLRCIGKVLRCSKVPEGEEPKFETAATLERYEFVRSEA